jgi:hypothetical protein
MKKTGTLEIRAATTQNTVRQIRQIAPKFRIKLKISRKAASPLRSAGALRNGARIGENRFCR